MPSPQRPALRHLTAWGLLALASAVPIAAWAQASNAPSVERIRAQSQRLKEYRELLNDRDANVRLAALDEMLKSNDAALRELAYDAAFSSADQNLRALALRSKILSMKNVVLELDPSEQTPEAQRVQLIKALGGSRFAIQIDNPDPQTGNFTVDRRTLVGRVSGQELTMQLANGSLRLRLGDGAVMSGHITASGATGPVRLTLQ